jgi:trehalose-phosphatase
MARLRIPAGDVIFLGDDITDEDAFRAAMGGLTFRVGDKDVETAAHYQINDTADVQAFLLCVLGVRSKVHTGTAKVFPVVG